MFTMKNDWTEEPIHPADTMYEVDTTKLIQYCRYMANQNMLRRMDLSRDENLRAKDEGHESVYKNIIFLINNNHLITKESRIEA